MKKIILVLLMVVFLSSCESTSDEKTFINEDFGYKAYVLEDQECDDAETLIAEENGYNYTLNCDYTQYYSLEDSDGNVLKIDLVLDLDLLTAEELHVLLDGHLVKTEIGINIPEAFKEKFDNNYIAEYEFLTTIEGYSFYNSMNSLQVCDMPVSFEIDGETFEASSGCSSEFATLGYFAVKDDQLLSIEELLENNTITIDDVITMIKSELSYDNVYLNVLTTKDQLLTQSEDLYYVYIYSLTCPHCNNIKLEVLDYLLNDATDKYYISGIHDLSSTGGYPSYLSGVPVLYKVENGEITETYTGTIEIKDHISN